jgi:hypothetical protein
MSELISLREAERRGLTKLQLDRWTNPDDCIELTLIDGYFGPWVKLWSPMNELCNQDNPHKFLITMLGDLDKPDWRPLPRELKR